jgi:citrate lyase beta subunit
MVRLLRTALYIPGNNVRALAKGPTLPADALILDLEDSVIPSEKIVARERVRTTLEETRGSMRLRTVRINGLSTPLWEADLRHILPGSPDALVVPKVPDAAALIPLCDRLDQWAGGGRSDVQRVELWPMIETPEGVLNAATIARHARVACLVAGSSDLAKGLGLRSVPVRRLSLLTALQQLVLAARAAGVQVLDGVFLDIQDAAGFAEQCQEGAEWGFDGKTVIHPKQLDIANQIFLPSDAELRWAERILTAWRAAQEAGHEICLVDGRLVERLHAQQAERLIALRDQAQRLQAEWE